MANQRQIIVKIAVAISDWRISGDYTRGLIEMASLVLGRDEQAIIAAARGILEEKLDKREIDERLKKLSQ